MDAIHEQLQKQGYSHKTLHKVFSTISSHQEPTAVTQQPSSKPHALPVAIVFAILLVGVLALTFFLLNDSSSQTSEERAVTQNNVPTQNLEVHLEDRDQEVVAPRAFNTQRPTQAGTATQEVSDASSGETISLGVEVGLAQETNDANSFCSTSPNGGPCITAFAVAKSSSDTCSVHSDVTLRDECYKQFILNGQTQLCDLVETPSVQATCTLLV